MIRVETVTIDDHQYTKTWSDAGRYVVREGVSYCEAIDPPEYNRQYTEGDYMEGYGVDLTNDEIVDILFGGAEE